MSIDPGTYWKRKHMNWPQRRSQIVRAKMEIAVMSRGVGKTEGIIGPRMAHNAFAMRRSLGGMVTPTYKKLFTELVPSIFSGLDNLGYIEGKHYVIGKRGPTKWDQPYKRVRDWTHAMHWCSGSGRAFISQDRPGMGNGLSLDDLIIDEGKLIDGVKFEDSTRQTLRGNRQHFDGLPEYQSILIVSDRPTTKRGKWFMKYKDLMVPEDVEIILQGAYLQLQRFEAIQRGGLSDSTVRDYTYEIQAIENELNQIRRHTTFYHEANALDNIDVIGWNNFLQMEADMDPRVFKVSIMNEEDDFIEGAWYPDLDEDTHCYSPAITSWTTDRGWDRDRLTSRDCRHDAEIVPTLPIDIGMDYGGRFNCIAIGQLFNNLLRIDNGFHGSHPSTTKDVVLQFVHYYEHHKNKMVYYHYDHTALDRHGTSPFTYYETVFNTLSESGWTVVPVNIGKTPSPKLRYEMFSSLLRQDDPPVMWNPDKCTDMLISMRMAQIKEGRNGIEKNKNIERGTTDEQVHAPHYSDAVDTLVWGRLQTLGSIATIPVPSIFVG